MTQQERATDRVKHTASAPASPQTGNPSFHEYVDAFMQTPTTHLLWANVVVLSSHLLLSPKKFRHLRTVVFRDVTSRDVPDDRICRHRRQKLCDFHLIADQSFVPTSDLS